MQAEKVTEYTVPYWGWFWIEIVIDSFIFNGKGLYVSSLLNIYAFFYFFVFFSFCHPCYFNGTYVRVITGTKIFENTLTKSWLLWLLLLWFFLKFLIKPRAILFKAMGR